MSAPAPAPETQSASPDPLDVIIVGAGVAGTSLAYALAQQKSRVALLERDWSERNTIIGELLQPAGLSSLLHLGLMPSAPSTPSPCTATRSRGQRTEGAEKLKNHLLQNTLPTLPPSAQAALRHALEEEKQTPRVMPNQFLPPAARGGKEGVVLLGDSYNMRHPRGMTVALNDVVLLSRALVPLAPLHPGEPAILDDWSNTTSYIDDWHEHRRATAGTVNVLSLTLYRLFAEGGEEGRVAWIICRRRGGLRGRLDCCPASHPALSSCTRSGSFSRGPQRQSTAKPGSSRCSSSRCPSSPSPRASSSPSSTTSCPA